MPTLDRMHRRAVRKQSLSDRYIVSCLQVRKDSHTRVAYERDATYGERVSKSCGGILFGWLLLCGAVLLMFWYEAVRVQGNSTIKLLSFVAL